jgi:hypothetical protein
MRDCAQSVIPAQAGIHKRDRFRTPLWLWIPACAGMTKEGRNA